MFWSFIVEQCQQNGVMLLIVVDSQGSTPAKIGAKLAITQTQTFGTIGGGAIEHTLIKTARHYLKQINFQSQITKHQHQLSSDHASGMICGGTQTVLMYACKLEELPLYQQLCDAQPITLNLTLSGMTLTQNVTKPKFQWQHDSWQYQETLHYHKHAYIIGGGHVSLALSRILRTLDYRITVLEQRDNIETFINNPYADDKHQVWYQQLNNEIPEGLKNYVFIMTHSHKTDAIALAQIHDKQLAYLGLLGSQQKIAQLTKGYNILKLHAPMGLNIHSHTPEEIAISIAAELIQLDNV